MAYTPTTWANGDTITAANLNKMEQGIAGATPIVVNLSTNSPYTLDRTFTEIYNALRAGTPVYILYLFNAGSDWASQYDSSVLYLPVVYAYKYNDVYRVVATCQATFTVGGTSAVPLPAEFVFSAANATAYPTYLRKGYPNYTYSATDTTLW